MRPIGDKLVIATHNPGKLVEMRQLLARYGVEAVSAGEAFTVKIVPGTDAWESRAYVGLPADVINDAASEWSASDLSKDIWNAPKRTARILGRPAQPHAHS